MRIPYTPTDKQPFVLLPEVYAGLMRLANFKIGDRVKLFIDDDFHFGTIKDIRGPSDTVGDNSLDGSHADENRTQRRLRCNRHRSPSFSSLSSLPGVNENDDACRCVQYECSTFRLWDCFVDNGADSSNNTESEVLWNNALKHSRLSSDIGMNSICLEWDTTTSLEKLREDRSKRTNRLRSGGHPDSLPGKRNRLLSSSSGVDSSEEQVGDKVTDDG